MAKILVCGATGFIGRNIVERLAADPTHQITAQYHDRPPFDAPGKKATFKRISRVDLNFPAYVSAGARDLITRLLAKDPKTRLSLSEVERHPWIVRKTNPDPVP